MAQAEAAFSVDDTKDPSAEATLVGWKFYNDVWVNGGREMAHEIVKKAKKTLMTPEQKQGELKKLQSAKSV
jgi:ribosomal protein S7